MSVDNLNMDNLDFLILNLIFSLFSEIDKNNCEIINFLEFCWNRGTCKCLSVNDFK